MTSRWPAEVATAARMSVRRSYTRTGPWTLGELRSTRETVYPLGLSDLITDVLTEGVPKRPVVLN